MSKTIQVFQYYFRNYYRSKSFYLMLSIDLLISSLLVYFSLMYSGSIDRLVEPIIANPPVELLRRLFDYIWNFALMYLPVLAAVFFGSPAISSEIEERTAFHIFPLPIGRYSLFVGKFLAAMAVSMIISLIFLAFEWTTFFLVFSVFQPVQFYYSLLIVVVFLFSILSITFLSSAIFNRNLYAYITVFVTYFLVFPSTSYVVSIFYGYSPSYLLNVAAEILQKIYVNLSIFSLLQGSSINPAPMKDIIYSIMIMLSYGFMSLVIALLLFERKEVT